MSWAQIPWMAQKNGTAGQKSSKRGEQGQGPVTGCESEGQDGEGGPAKRRAGGQRPARSDQQGADIPGQQPEMPKTRPSAQNGKCRNID
jgi:hypothetical protein